MLALDGRIDLANLALLLDLSGTLTALWLPALPSLLFGTAAVLAFNWQFVPPRGILAVDGGQNLLLLGAMALVNAVITGLMARLRSQARLARHHQLQAEQSRSLDDRCATPASRWPTRVPCRPRWLHWWARLRAYCCAATAPTAPRLTTRQP